MIPQPIVPPADKDRNTIRQWCESGFLANIGIATYRDHRGRWYIRIK
jgi:hypothetical protein